jgi:hypothetical protein
LTAPRIISAAALAVVFAMVLVYLAVTQTVRYRIDRSLQRLAAELDLVSQISYRRFTWDWIERSIDLTDVVLVLTDAAAPVIIDGVVIRGLSAGDRAFDTMGVALSGVRLVPTAVPYPWLQNAMAAVGYPQVRFSLECRYRYFPKQRRLDVGALVVEAAGVGRGRLVFSLENIDPLLLGNNIGRPAVIAVLAAGIRIRSGSAEFQNDALVQRWMAASARRQGLDMDAVRRRLYHHIDRLGGILGPSVAADLAAVKRFVAAPAAIQVVVAPAAPVSIARLMWVRDPVHWTALLNPSIRIQPQG